MICVSTGRSTISISSGVEPSFTTARTWLSLSLPITATSPRRAGSISASVGSSTKLPLNTPEDTMISCV